MFSLSVEDDIPLMDESLAPCFDKVFCVGQVDGRGFFGFEADVAVAALEDKVDLPVVSVEIPEETSTGFQGTPGTKGRKGRVLEEASSIGVAQVGGKSGVKEVELGRFPEAG